MPGIHPSAVVAEGVTLGAEVCVQANAVIESGVVLGDRVVVGAGSVIGADCVIGDDTRLHARDFTQRLCDWW